MKNFIVKKEYMFVVQSIDNVIRNRVVLFHNGGKSE